MKNESVIIDGQEYFTKSYFLRKMNEAVAGAFDNKSPVKRGRKPKAVATEASPAAEVAPAVAGKKRGRKSNAQKAAEAAMVNGSQANGVEAAV